MGEAQQLQPIIPKPPIISKRSLASVLGVLILLLGLPIGVYLVSQETDFLPKASTPLTNQISETSMVLTSNQTNFSTGEEIAVAVIVHSDSDPANLFVAKIDFPKDLLFVTGIATSSAKFANGDYFVQKWIQTSFDNDAGEITLAGGVANPGFKTDTKNSTKSVLATVIFKAKKDGTASLVLRDTSAIYRNSDNSNILKSKSDLTLQILKDQKVCQSASDCPANYRCLTPDLVAADTPAQASSSAVTTGGYCQQILTDQSTSSASLKPGNDFKLVSPKGGEIFSYDSTVPISWEGSQTDPVSLSVSLYINDKFLGKIISDTPNINRYNWLPKDTLPISYIGSNNTYKIEVQAKTTEGSIAQGISQGPFGIILGPVSLPVASGSAKLDGQMDLNGDGKSDFKDISRLLSGYYSNQKTDSDINLDGVVNDIDLWLLKNKIYHSSMSLQLKI